MSGEIVSSGACVPSINWYDDVVDAVVEGLPDHAASANTPSQSFETTSGTQMETHFPPPEEKSTFLSPDALIERHASDDHSMVGVEIDSRRDITLGFPPSISTSSNTQGIFYTRANEIKYDGTWPRNFRQGPAYERFPKEYAPLWKVRMEQEELEREKQELEKLQQEEAYWEAYRDLDPTSNNGFNLDNQSMNDNRVAVESSRLNEAEEMLPETNTDIDISTSNDHGEMSLTTLNGSIETVTVDPSLLTKQDSFEMGCLEAIDASQLSFDSATSSSEPTTEEIKRPQGPKVVDFPWTYFEFSSASQFFLKKGEDLRRLGIKAEVAKASCAQYEARHGTWGLELQRATCARSSKLRRCLTVVQDEDKGQF